MPIVSVFLVAAVMAGPTPAAKTTTADQQELVEIIGTLHMVENELMRQSVLGLPEYPASLQELLDLVRKAGREQLAPNSRGCQPGFCPKDDMCVPCEPPPPQSPRMLAAGLSTVIPTLHLLEDKLMRDFVLSPSEFKNSARNMRTLAREAAKVLDMPKRGCQPGFCPKDGMCYPCMPIRK